MDSNRVSFKALQVWFSGFGLKNLYFYLENQNNTGAVLRTHSIDTLETFLNFTKWQYLMFICHYTIIFIKCLINLSVNCVYVSKQMLLIYVTQDIKDIELFIVSC